MANGGESEFDGLYQQEHLRRSPLGTTTTITTVTATSTSLLLADTFFVGAAGHKRHRVRLTKKHIAWQNENDNNDKSEKRVPLAEVIAAEPGEVGNESGSGSASGCLWSLLCFAKWKKKVVLFPEEPHPLQVNTFRLHYVSGCGNDSDSEDADAARRRQRQRQLRHRWKVHTLNFTHSDHNVIRLWIATIRDIIKGFQNRPRRLVVFVNPFGGKKKAPEIYERKVRPLFELAQVDVQVITTERANHASETLQEIPIAKFDGVVCVGGDGMFSELLNGLLRRTQVDKAVPLDDSRAKLCRPHLRLGIIPGGSTDAVAFCTSGTNDPVTAALHIILGDSLGLDVCTIHQGQRLVQFSTTLLAYGFFGDTLIESERHRWMGPKRYDWAGFKKLLQLKAYTGEVAFRCVPPATSSPLDRRRCRTGCRVCAQALINVREHGTSDDTVGWTIVKGKFYGVNNATTTCACTRAKKGISPSAHVGDGCTDLILVHKTSWFNYVRYMLATARRGGNPFELGFVKVHRVREFQFRACSLSEDDDEDDNNDDDDTDGEVAHNEVVDSIQDRPRTSSLPPRRSSVWNCDGEIISEPSIDVKVHCQLVNIFARGVDGCWLDDDDDDDDDNGRRE